ILEPDPPPEERPEGYAVKDHLPGDNRQDFALEVLPALPVLLVDGDARSDPPRRGTDFLRDALAPARDPTPAVRTHVVSVRDFQPALLDPDATRLARGSGRGLGVPPRVLVLSNVPRLTEAQQDAVARFVADGGGVLVTLGERADARQY